MAKIQIALDIEDWYEVIDALKFKEFECMASAKRAYSFLSFDDYLRVEGVIRDYERKALNFYRLSKEIYSEMYSSVFRSGYGYKKEELEQEEHKKLPDEECEF